MERWGGRETVCLQWNKINSFATDFCQLSISSAFALFIYSTCLKYPKITLADQSKQKQTQQIIFLRCL